MLIDDGVNAIQDIKQQGTKGLLNSYRFDSFYHLYYLIIVILYKLFGLSPWGWFLFFSFTHSLNAFLLFKLLRALGSSITEKAVELALYGSLLFLWSPMAAENIVWAATAHYNVACMLLMLSSLLLIKRIERNKYPGILFYMLHAMALLCFELSFLFPFFFVFIFYYFKTSNRTQLSYLHYFVKVILPLFIFIGIYLLLLYINKGTLMPHAAQNTFSGTDLHSLLSKFVQNTFRLIFPIQFLSFSYREATMQACTQLVYVLPLIVILLASITYIMFKKNRNLGYLFLLFLMSYLLFLAPFCTRALMYLFKYENIRYVYFASAFFYPLLLLCASFIHSKIPPILFAIYSLGYLYFITKTVQDRRESATVYHRIIKDIPVPTQGQQIYLLNTPTYASDWMLFWDSTRLPIALYCYRDMDTSIRLHQIISYNAMSTKDSFEVKKESDSSWQFRLLTNGSWLMRGYLGATSYSADDYDCQVGEWGLVRLRFKKKLQAHQRLYYFDGYTYRELR